MDICGMGDNTKDAPPNTEGGLTQISPIRGGRL